MISPTPPSLGGSLQTSDQNGTEQYYAPSPPQATTSPSHPELRSPSPKRPSASNILGLGLPVGGADGSGGGGPASSAAGMSSVITSYPHLAHYVFNLLATSVASPPRAAPVHPLSVSSSGESDGSDEDAGPSDESEPGLEHQTPRKKVTAPAASAGVGHADRDRLVRQIVQLLDQEEEEQVKEVLRPYLGDLAKVSSSSLRTHVHG